MHNVKEADQARRRLGSDPVVTFDARTPYAVLDKAHRGLREGLAQLRTALASDGSLGPEGLSTHIGAVRSSLVAHFAFEENHGSLHYLDAAQPALQPELETLRAEHRAILEAFDRVIAAVDKGLPDLGARMSSVLDRLANHELNQHDLVRRALRGLIDPSATAARPGRTS
jgi:hypothetical protein